jgi:hypothetical protein
MTLKQFLKSDWRKFSLFCFFSVLFLFFGIDTSLQKPRNVLSVDSVVKSVIDTILIFSLGFIVVVIIGLASITAVIDLGFFKLSVLSLIFIPYCFIIFFLHYLRYWNYKLFDDFIVLYLLLPSFVISYLIVWIYDKKKKR